MKRYMTMVAAAILLAASCSKPAEASGEFELSLTSFNVLGVESKAAWEPRLSAIKDAVDGHSPDVFCTQECSDTNKQNDLKALFKDRYDCHTMIISGAQASPALIFWDRARFDKVKSGSADMLLGDPGYSTSQYTGSRYAHFVQLREKTTGGEFLVYSVHVKSNGTNVSYHLLRYDCISALCPAAKARSASAGNIPVFIVGDFNNYIDTAEGDLVSAPAVCVENGFSDAAAVADECVNLNYKTSGIDMSGKATKKDSGNYRIDYLFSYPGGESIDVLKYMTVIDFVEGSDVDIKTPVPSDHHPVNAIYKIKY